MGNYLNPGNIGFEEIRNSQYVDKSGLIALINDTIGTKQKLTCISRPRRFGKSFAAQMLCAYYDKTCDSSALFEDLEISTNEKLSRTYKQHLNRYDVIYLDMTAVIGAANAVSAAGNKFIMVIDEWDAPIREAGDQPIVQKEYLEFLRSLFKNSGMTAKVFAAAYMTGILPIKKDASQSAISDFEEFTMVKPRKFGTYVGFTEDEVRKFCTDYNQDFAKMKQWYDGYSFRGVDSVYNPNSVMKAIRNDDFDSYWTQTSAAESLMGYISLDFDGLSRTVTELLGGVPVKVDTSAFANDLVTFRNRDDVLTLLIHLGYLAYDEKTECVRIPNEEIRMEFTKTIREVKRDETIRRVRESDQLIQVIEKF
ncbi:MAG: AAA family ATPase [Oliverpabstia sp.]|nr:AAA family ATPase [Eubacterium sp.]